MSVGPADWEHVRAIFDAAVALDPRERAAYLAGACGADAPLRRQVEALLGSHERAGTFLETSAALLIDRSVDVIGRTAGSYRIVARVGAGSMGEVYRAHDAKLDRPVALKLLPSTVAADADRLRRFHAEARAASSLNHPNILVIHDFGDLDGRPFIVSEFVAGETLRARLNRGPVPVAEAVDIAMQLAGALSAAHARGIVHRDIKPENVMVRPDGYVKVLDFGLAKLLGPPLATTPASAGATEPGLLMGTPHYMSPEQAHGDDVDERSDIFGLGVVLYELATGVRPFTGETPMSVLASIVRDTPRPVTELNSALPRELAPILERCLAKDRAHRYQSANDLRRDLDELQRSPRSRASGIDSLAVLPFENASGDPDVEYLSDGITETLINRLSQIPRLRVVPRSIAFRYKGRDIDPHKVGRQLKVRALLTGKVLQRGDSLNVQAELVDVKEQAQLGGERFSRRVSDILAVEDEIAGQIADHLRLTLTGEERERLAKRYTEDTDAYRLYLKGRYHWSKRTGADLKKSAEYFEQAIEKDPGYALPYAGMSDAYLVMSFFDVAAPAGLLSKAKKAALRALQIDPDLPEAHAALSVIGPCLDSDWAMADDEFRSAMRRKPPYWLAHTHYSMTVAARGRFEEAVAEVRRGQALEPLSLVAHHHVAWICVLARRYDEAIAECRSAIEMDPTFGMPHLWLGISLEQKGLYEEAIASLDHAVRLIGGVSISVASAAHAYAMSGRKDEARRRLDALLASRSERYVQPYGIALVYAALGDVHEALSWLEQAHQEHAGWLPLWARGDARLDVLRNEPRFQDLLRRLGVGEGER